MNKSYLIIISILILLILGVSFALLFGNDKNSILTQLNSAQQKTNQSNDNISNNPNPTRNIESLFGGNNNQGNCFTEFAIKTQNSEICSEISSQRWKDVCYRNVAEENGDEALCLKIESDLEKAYCYSGVAMFYKNDDYCNKIDPNSQFGELNITNCLNVVLSAIETVNSCENKNSEEQKHICYSSFARKNKDQNICEKINIDSRRESCYIGVAEVTEDINYCDLIISNETKENCFFSVAKISRNPSICDKMNGPSANLKDVCYFTTNKDASLCETQSDKNRRDECYENVALSTNNIDYCYKIN